MALLEMPEAVFLGGVVRALRLGDGGEGEAMAGMTPTARTLARCRQLGWMAHVVEKWIPQTRRRIDAFGFGDVLVIEPNVGILLIQATADNGGHVADRVAKIQGEKCRDAAQAWLRAGARIEVWGWGKRGPRGKRKTWTLRRVQVWGVDAGDTSEVV